MPPPGAVPRIAPALTPPAGLPAPPRLPPITATTPAAPWPALPPPPPPPAAATPSAPLQAMPRLPPITAATPMMPMQAVLRPPPAKLVPRPAAQQAASTIAAAAAPDEAPVSLETTETPEAPEAPKKRAVAIELQTSGEEVVPLVSAWDDPMMPEAPPPAPAPAVAEPPETAPTDPVQLAAPWEFVGYQGDAEIPPGPPAAPPVENAPSEPDWGAALTPDDPVAVAMAAMKAATQADTITGAFLGYCEREFSRAFWFIIQYGVAMLWRGLGPGSDGAVVAFRPELKEPSMFKTAVETGKPSVVTAPDTSTDEAFFWAISPPAPSYAITVPVMVDGSARELLCVVGDEGAPSAEAVTVLERLAACAAHAHQRLAGKP